MHIPNHMLQGHICPVTAVVSAMGIFIAAIMAARSKEKPSASRFAAVTSFIFAAQMMNFPIQNGTSGHFLGGVLAVSLLGTSFGVMSMAIVVVIQCLIFSDGGFTVLGANVFNMALIGAGLAGFLKTNLLKDIKRFSKQYMIGLGFVAWLSVMLAAFAVSMELSLSGTIAFSKVIFPMMKAHSFIGIGEALITVVTVYAFSDQLIGSTEKRSVIVPLSSAVVIAALLSPFASSFPDGLEWVAQKYSFLHESMPSFVSPLSDYSVYAINKEAISTGVAGLIGVLFTFGLAWAVAKMLRIRAVTSASV
jgi:cobalt/nickel transport system permease protein